MSVRLLSLSAGTVLGASPEEALGAAVAAGFDAFGVRHDPDRLPRHALPPLRRRIEGAGVQVLDVEVVRLRPDVPLSAHRPWADAAEDLGARFLLVVSHHADSARTAADLAALAEWCQPAGVTVALEFMPFTSVPTFAAAGRIVRQADVAGVTVVVDALHLQRAGESPADLQSADAGPVGYVQVSDAPKAAPGAGHDLALLADEARSARLLPGDGELPLRELLTVLPPGSPVSVEVQSDRWAGVGAGERARRAMDSMRTLLRSAAGAAAGTRGS